MEVKPSGLEARVQPLPPRCLCDCDLGPSTCPPQKVLLRLGALGSLRESLSLPGHSVLVDAVGHMVAVCLVGFFSAVTFIDGSACQPRLLPFPTSFPSTDSQFHRKRPKGQPSGIQRRNRQRMTYFPPKFY